jgi:hypothetical protein
MHEIVDETLRRFLPTLDLWLEYGHLTVGDKVSYTLCYLTLASDTSEGYIVGGRTEPAAAEQFCRQGDHRAFQQIIDPSLLTLTESHRLRFKKAMRVLDILPCYHLSELEAHVKHPIRDKALSRLCSCSEDGCEPAHYMDEQEKADSFDRYLDDKSKGELHKKTCGPLLNAYLILSRASERALAEAHGCCCFRCGGTLSTHVREDRIDLCRVKVLRS